MQRREKQFEFGPVSQGIYRAMLWAGLLIPLYFPAWTAHYLVLLIFLGIGLRPVLEYTGLWVWWDRLESPFARHWSDRELERHRRQIDARLRQEALKKRRVRDEP